MESKWMASAQVPGTKDLICVLVFLCLRVNSECLSVRQVPAYHTEGFVLSGHSTGSSGASGQTPGDNSSVPSMPGSLRAESLSGESIEVSWTAPDRPGGTIIGYNLNLTDQSHTVSSTVGTNEFSASFFPTSPNTTYRITAVAVNRDGQGPAAEVNFTTPAREEQRVGRWLFLSRLNSLRKKEVSAGIMTEADCLPERLANITGVAVHPNSSQVYFSEGLHIWVKGAVNLTDPRDLRQFHSAPLEVTALSVDWLYRKLYFLSGGKVFHCGLESCSDLVDVTPPLSASPSKVIADPYNGYLFLLLPDGIYRAVLPEVAEGQTHNLTRVVTRPALLGMTVSFVNQRLVFFDRTNRTISATRLDGSDLVTLRSQVGSLRAVRSLAYEDDLFALTNGRAVYQEEKQGNVFNEFLVDCDIFEPSSTGFDNVQFSSPTSQPYPVPRRPRELQVLFGSDRVTARWNQPPLRRGTSPSAWQNWKYAVRIAHLNGTAVTGPYDVTETQLTIGGLQGNHGYRVTVWAESPGGGSAPVESSGSTLKPVRDDPFILGAGPNGLWKQDLSSFNELKLVAFNITSVKDMDWYNSTVYWSNSLGHINAMELSDSAGPSALTSLPLSTGAGALALDWLGLHLYWSCSSTSICRGPVSSPESEVFLSTSGAVSALALDPLHAFLYWATEHAVERVRLDGRERTTLQRLGVLSGSKVSGITIDVPGGILYWLVQDASVLHLYRAGLRNRPEDINITEVIGWTSSEVSHHALVYYSGRLVWLDGCYQLRIQEVGQSQSAVLSSGHRLNTFTLLQSTLKPLPDGFVSRPVVIPQAVPESSITMRRNNTVLHIQWEPSSNVEFGLVFYCVKTAVLTRKLAVTNQKFRAAVPCVPSDTASEPAWEVRGTFTSSTLNITITPFTYWGKGAPTSTVLLLPTPDEPTDVILIIVFSTLMGIFTVLLITAVVVWLGRLEKRAPEPDSLEVSIPNSDEELEAIRGLVGLANACYAVSPLPVHTDTAALPVFPRDCLRLQRLLGTGAFGEVYEGVTVGQATKEVTSSNRVAVKTLRKGATDGDKVEFLKEAHLMSQFEHPNILGLLGVCVQNEPQYLILELMDGGDLRSYLRGARRSGNRAALLGLPELLDICCDTANGCAYLEKMHFVHRDLAARNCLVSAKGYTGCDRTVKIGDFGLARDVYKNDYYRKRGEGLLPVRWMSPESLSDGVFNKHTDVWSFGVLLWEVATLGQQPYPALSNLEVLHHINSGGRLSRPAECPEKLYELMLRCWSKKPSNRPSFRSLQDSLALLRASVAQLSATLDGPAAHVNQAYEEEEEFSRVDEDEITAAGLTHVLSEEGLNYLMFNAE